MSKTQFESLPNVQIDVSDSFSSLKIEQRTLTEKFRRRNVPEDRGYIECAFRELSESLVPSMGAAK